jgi:hypothetical protein
MTQPLRNFIFTLYEQRGLRNWFYTVAFAIFVPTGFRFAILAWEYGDWFDKPLSIVAGLLIGMTSAVTLVRVWTVPPSQTFEAKTAQEKRTPPLASQICDAAKQQATHNREIARGAAALGSSRRWPFEH